MVKRRMSKNSNVLSLPKNSTLSKEWPLSVVDRNIAHWSNYLSLVCCTLPELDNKLKFNLNISFVFIFLSLNHFYSWIRSGSFRQSVPLLNL